MKKQPSSFSACLSACLSLGLSLVLQPAQALRRLDRASALVARTRRAMALLLVLATVALATPAQATVETIRQSGGGATWSLVGETSPVPGNTYTYTITKTSGTQPLNEYVGFYVPSSSAVGHSRLGLDPTSCASTRYFCASFSPATRPLILNNVSSHHSIVSQINSNDKVTATLAVAAGTPVGTTIAFGAIVNNGSPRATVMVLTVTGNPVTTGASIISTPRFGDTYGRGETIEVELQFDQNVDVTGSPLLSLNIGNSGVSSAARDATYHRGSGTNQLVFRYTLNETLQDTDGLRLFASPLRLNGGTIRSAIIGDLDAQFTLANFFRLQPQSQKVDGRSVRTAVTTGARIISRPRFEDTYGLDETIEVELQFDHNVAVTGSPLLSLNIGNSGVSSAARDATYHRGSGTTRLVFRYTVERGLQDTDGLRLFANPLRLNGGSIRTTTASPVDAQFTLANFFRLQPQSQKLDGSSVRVAPDVISIVRQDPSSASTNGNNLTPEDTLKWRVTFSEPVTAAATDFTVTNVAGARVTAVTAVSGITGAYAEVWDVTVRGSNFFKRQGRHYQFKLTIFPSFGSGSNRNNIRDQQGIRPPTRRPSSTHEGYELDNIRPALAITGVPDPITGPFTATFTFTQSSAADFPGTTGRRSDAVTGFEVNDIVLTNARVLELTPASFESIGGGPWQYEARITPTAAGTITLEVADNAAQDAAGNGNTGARVRVSSTYIPTLPTLTIAADTTLVTEGTAAAFTLSRSGATTAALTVAVNVTEAGDMVATANKGAKSVTFAVGSATAALSVATVADSLDEADSVVTATVANDSADPATYTPGTPASASVTVADDDLSRITIAPGQDKATGKLDFIHYTLTREGATTATQAVTVTLDPPAGNDWNIPSNKLSHDVTFSAGSATATLSVWLKSAGFRAIGFSHLATMGGTLTARIEAVAGFDNRDTAEVEVLVFPNPVWVFSLTETEYSFAEDGGAQTVTIEVRASSPEVPAPTSSLSATGYVGVNIVTAAGTATTADYTHFTLGRAFGDSQFGPDADGHQHARVDVTLTPTDDSLVEPHETLTLRLLHNSFTAGKPYGLQSSDGTIRNTVGAQADYPATIVDDDTGLLSMAVTSTPSLMATGSTAADTYGTGNTIEFTATFNNRVTVSGTPEFEFVLGTTNKRATYVRGSGSTELVFSYTVVAADTDSDGISWAANKIVKASSATIRKMGTTTDAVITHALQGTLSGHRVDGSQARAAVTIAAGTTPVTEGTAAAFTLSRSGATTAALTVAVNVTETGAMVATANKGAKSVTFEIGEATATLSVATVTDSIDEDDSAVTATVAADSNSPATYTPGTPASAEVTVADDDAVPLPEVTVAAGTTPVTEGTAAVFTLSRSGATTAALTVNVGVTEDGAVVAAANKGAKSVTFEIGEATATLSVATVADTAGENDSVVTATVADDSADPATYAPGTPASATVTVADDDGGLPTVSIAAVYPTATPQYAHPEFRVTIDRAQPAAVRVRLAISQDSNYLSDTSPTITIPANQTSVTGKLIAASPFGRNSGTLTATVVAGSGYQPAAASASVATVSMVINNPQLIFHWQEAAYTVTEGDTLMVTVELRTTVGLPQPREGFRYGFLTLEGTAELNVDYPHISRTVRVEPGDWSADGSEFVATSTVPVATLQDEVYEGTERFAIVLTKAAGGRGPTCNVGINTSFGCETAITLTDDDPPPPELTITAGTTPVTEGTAAEFTLRRTGAVTAALTAEVTVSESGDVVATADEGTKQVTFAVGSATATLSVASVADTAGENDSVVIATISADTADPATYTLGTPASATVTVADDDTVGVTISESALTINEGGSGSYTVVLDTQPTATVTVTPSVTGDSDVTFSPATLSFTTGNWNTAQEVTVSAAEDDDETADSATITHGVAGADYALVNAAAVAVTVTDNDSADSTAPGVASIARQTPATSPTNADSLIWRVTFSEAVENVDAADFALSGSTATLAVAAVSSVMGGYDVTASGGNLAGLNGTVILSFAAAQNIQDLAGNALANTTPTGANNASYAIDNTAPTLAISGVPAASDAPFTATFTFSEDITGFAAGDISLVNATLSAFTTTTSGAVYTALITPTADGTVTLNVAADAAQDTAGNSNTAVARASSIYTASALPVITISAGTTLVTEGTAAAFTLRRTGATTAALTVAVTVTETGEMVAAANKGTQSVTFGTGSASATLSVATVDDTAGENDSVVTATVAADTANPATYTPGTPTLAAVTVSDDDGGLPTLSITASSPSVTEGTDAVFVVRSAAPVSSNLDVTVQIQASPASQLTMPGGLSMSGTTGTRVDIGPVRIPLGQSEATIRIPSGPVLQIVLGGVVSQGYLTATLVKTPAYGVETPGIAEVRLDAMVDPADVLPVVTLALQDTASAVTEGDTIEFVVSRPAPPAPLQVDDLLALEVNVRYHLRTAGVNDPVVDTVTLEAGTLEKIVTISIPDNEVVDPGRVLTIALVSGTGYTISDTASVAVTVTDNDSAGVTVSESDLSVAEGSTGTYTVVLTSQPTGEVTITPSSDNSDVTLSPSTLTFTATDWSTAQEVTVSAAEDDDAAQDSATITHNVAGADYTAVTAANVAVTVTDNDPADSTAPRLVSIKRVLMPSPTNADRLTWRLTFSEAVRNVDAVDFALSGTSATLMVISTSSVRDYIVTASGGDLAGLDGTVSLSLAAVQNIQDLAGNALANTTPTGANNADYAIDNTAPTLAISGVPATSDAPFTATFTFSEDVTGFAVDDISLVNATLSAFSASSGAVYTARVTPTANGTVTLDVAADVARDTAGNGNSAAARASSRYTAPILPVITISAGTTPLTEGTAAVFTLTRTGATTAALTVNVMVTESGDVVAGDDEGARQITFTANSATAALSVATVDDRIDAADSVVTATVADDSADPATYTPGSPASATVTVADDDSAGVTVSESALTVAEGTTGTYTMVLTSQPTGEVTVTPSSDNREVTLSPATLSFTATNWNNAQMVTVSAAEDADSADDSATIAHSVAGADYALVTAANVAVTVTDNDDEIVANHPATGAPVIEGALTMASVLTADTSQIRDADGLDGVVYQYQWLRIDGAGNGRGEREIAGATEGTYRISEQDIGHRLRLRVAFEDARGNPEQLYSAPTAAVSVVSREVAQAWLGRFGRTVSEQVLTVVDGRLHSSREAGSSLRLAGHELAQESGDKAGYKPDDGWRVRDKAEEDRYGSNGGRGVSGREWLTGSSFNVTSGSEAGNHMAFWGGVAANRFSGQQEAVAIEGEVISGQMGADWRRRWGTAGLLLSHARGEGDYRVDDDSGTIESTLTGVYPFVGYTLNDRTSLWGVAGYGSGESRYRSAEGGGWYTSDLSLSLAAAGIRTVVRPTVAGSGLELSLVADGLLLRAESDASLGIAAESARVNRVRTGLEGRWHGLGSGLTPVLELGLRHDGGDVEKGFGADLGGGVDWHRGRFELQVRGRGLLTHEDSAFRNRGFSGMMSWQSQPSSSYGLKLRMQQSVGGSATGGVAALHGRETIAGLHVSGSSQESPLSSRTEMSVAYGMPFGRYFIGTPEVGLGITDQQQDYRVGWRLDLRRNREIDFALGLEVRRRENLETEDAGYEATLQLRANW